MSGPFGVDLPTDLGSNPEVSESTAPETSGEENNEAQSLGDESSSQATKQQLLDLDKADKFLFKGREWTRKEWEDGHLRHQDYTQKTQELAQQRKFVENFNADLGTVINDPSRMADFERIYPREYVEHAKAILQRATGQPKQAQPEKASLKDDPEFQEIKSELSQWKQEKRETEIKEIQTWLDNQFVSLSKKYPFALPEVINARAEAIARGGQKITEDVLGKLFKANNDELKKRYEGMQRDRINKQINAAEKSRDAGMGGDAPSGAPKVAKTIKEATAGWLSQMTNNG